MSGDSDTTYCGNCKRNIAVANYVMHEVHCRRNLMLCKKCNEPVPKSDTQEHFDEYHAEVPCNLCQGSIEKSKVEEHLDFCPKRPISCEFCQLDFSSSDILSHRDYCGSRTEPCKTCGQFIMLKDEAEHQITDCGSTNTSSINHGRSDDGHDLNNSFAMGELRRMMPQVPGGMLVGGTSHIPMVVNEFNGVTGRDKPKNKSNKNAARNRRSNNVNIRSDHDVIGNDEMYPGDHDLDTDELLARILSQDESEEASLPCEVCDNLFPLSALSDHQRKCRAVNISDLSLPQNNVTQNATVTRTLHVPSVDRQPITIVDNLSMLTAQERLRDINLGEFTDFSDDDFLPCEFCDELLPSEFLIQHQAVCRCNLTQTPRVMTPAVPKNDTGVVPQRKTMQRQPDPNLDFLSQYTDSHNVGADDDESHDQTAQPVVPPVVKKAQSTNLAKHVNQAAERKQKLEELKHNPMAASMSMRRLLSTSTTTDSANPRLSYASSQNPLGASRLRPWQSNTSKNQAENQPLPLSMRPAHLQARRVSRPEETPLTHHANGLSTSLPSTNDTGSETRQTSQRSGQTGSVPKSRSLVSKNKNKR